MLLNIGVFRWQNPLFHPLWSHVAVESVDILFSEDIGVDERGGVVGEQLE